MPRLYNTGHPFSEGFVRRSLLHTEPAFTNIRIQRRQCAACAQVRAPVERANARGRGLRGKEVRHSPQTSSTPIARYERNTNSARAGEVLTAQQAAT